MKDDGRWLSTAVSSLENSSKDVGTKEDTPAATVRASEVAWMHEHPIIS